MAAKRKPPARRAAPDGPDPIPFPRATDPPAGPVSLRTRPHRVEYLPVPLPDYTGLRLGVCVSFSPTERDLRKAAVAAEVNRRVVAVSAPARRQAEADLRAATSAAQEAQATAEADPDNADLAAAAVDADIVRQAAALMVEAARVEEATLRNQWEFYAAAFEHLVAWDRGAYTGPLPDPEDWETWPRDCPDDLVYWCYQHRAEFLGAARAQMLPNLLALSLMY